MQEFYLKPTLKYLNLLILQLKINLQTKWNKTKFVMLLLHLNHCWAATVALSWAVLWHVHNSWDRCNMWRHKNTSKNKRWEEKKERKLLKKRWIIDVFLWRQTWHFAMSQLIVYRPVFLSSFRDKAKPISKIHLV